MGKKEKVAYLFCGILAFILGSWGICELLLKDKLARFPTDEVLAMYEPYVNNYVNPRRYRFPFFWKRPFLRRPFSMRRPFDYYRPDYYPPVILAEQGIGAWDPEEGRCWKVDQLVRGTARIPPVDLGSTWTIDMQVRFDRFRTDDDTLLFRKGQNSPSPMIVYSPSDNAFVFIVGSQYHAGLMSEQVGLGKSLSPYGGMVRLTWIQDGQRMRIMINDKIVKEKTLGSAVKVSSGTGYLLSYPFVSYKDFKMCDYARM